MPQTQTADTNTGATGPTSFPEKPDAATVINRTLALLGRQGAARTTKTGVVVPSGRARAALEVFAKAGTIENLDAQQVNLKALVKDLLDWDNKPGEQTRANGNVVKAVALALQARDDNGTSRYAQGVEMLGFACAVAPLLQGDRIARLIAEAPKVDTAYGPDRYTLRFTRVARTILNRYPEQRRETLLVSLWHLAHEGRFWDITAGVTEVDAEVRRRRNREEQEARDAIVNDALDGHDRGSEEAHAAIMTSLAMGTLPWNIATAALVAELPRTDEFAHQLAQIATALRAGDHVHPDTIVLCSHIPWAQPDERPESPIAWVMHQLASALDADTDTGEILLEKLPEKPKKWSDLFPGGASVTGFPHPPAARALDGQMLPGTDDIRVEVVRNGAMLAENATYMGNCTAGYKQYMEQGGYILFRLHHRGQIYNAAMRAWNVGDRWAVSEINSRFNGGNVPGHMRQAFTQLAAQMPPRAVDAKAEELPEARTKKFRVTG